MLDTKMPKIKKFDLNKIIVGNNLSKKAINYLINNPCCTDFPNCNHPVYQSDPLLWKNKEFYFLNKKIYQIICDLYQNILDLNCQMWVYYQKKNSILKDPEWHNHVIEGGGHQLSFLIYLNFTELGTIFDFDGKIKSIQPETNVMYLWDSHINHSPQPGKNMEERVVLAGACSFDL